MTTEHIFAERDGQLEFIGDFDGLYRESADPWGQSGACEDTAGYYRMSRGRRADALAQLLPLEGRRMEIGCGHGWTLPQFETSAGGVWEGMDICPAALAKAQQLHPGFNFYIANIMNTPPAPPNMFGRYDCVILSQLLWYVLPQLGAVVQNAARFLSIGGLLVISQAFLRDQRYGREHVDGFAGTLAHLVNRHQDLALIEARYEDSGAHPFNDGLLIARKLRHAQ